MSLTTRSKLVKIGNSRGVRIPRTLLDQAGLTDEIEMRVEGNALVILSARKARQSWGQAFADMAAAGDDALLDENFLTQWDEEEWEW